MNTKYKRSVETLPRSLGRPFGVLPLVAQPEASRRSNSIERRLFKRTLSTGSIASVSANQTRPESQSANVRRLSGQRIPQTESESSGHGRKHTNKDKTAAPINEKSRSFNQKKKGLATSDILKLCLEDDPSKVFEVDLHGKEVTCVPDLGAFNKLRILDLSGNHVKKILGLNSVKELRELKLYDNEITVIEGLDNLKELCCLQLQHNKISTVGQGLSSLKKLQRLRLDNNRIGKLQISDLVSCSSITSLDLSHNRLDSLAPLSYLPNLEELFASGNQIKKTGDLTKCKKLQEVDLSRNQISDLSGLANLPNLQNLDVSYNLIKTLESVVKLRSLEELNINNNVVERLSCIANLFPTLQILLACNNSISKWDEICHLSECVELVELYVADNPFIVLNGESPHYHGEMSDYCGDMPDHSEEMPDSHGEMSDCCEEMPHSHGETPDYHGEVSDYCGEMLDYRHAITRILPGLEVIDGVTLKKSSIKEDRLPLMRPMSASSVVSVRQLDSQLKAATEEQGNMLKSMTERFDALRAIINSLPCELPRPRTSDSLDTTTGSRCSSRSRLMEAKNFAAMNFHDDEGGGLM